MLLESGGVIFRFTPCKCPDFVTNERKDVAVI
jgi:hypothetical protein